MKILISKCILPIIQKPIVDGALLINKHRILDIGLYSNIIKKYPSVEKVDLSEYIILPGFVNCHSHLELSALKDKVKYNGSFADWIRKVITLKAKLSKNDIVLAIRDGISQLWESGVVAVADICSNGLAFQELISSNLIGRVYWEYIALKPNEVKEKLNKIDEQISHYSYADNISHGISPHSPYTLCSKAFREVTSYIRQKSYHSAIHLGESSEEESFFNSRSGELFSFINSYNPVEKDINNTYPLSYLDIKKYLTKSSIIIHLNILDDREISIIKRLNLSIIHCSRSHSFFSHPEFKMDKLIKNGINIALGTDSLASNYSLNFFEELRQVKENFCQLTPEQVINLATINGARALKLNNGLGIIKKGYNHYLIAVYTNSSRDPYNTIIYNNKPVIHIGQYI